MQEFRCKTLNIQNSANWFFTKLTLKIMIRMINVMWEIMTKRCYMCLRLSTENDWKSQIRIKNNIWFESNEQEKWNKRKTQFWNSVSWLIRGKCDSNYVQKLIWIKWNNLDKKKLEKVCDSNHVQNLIRTKSNRSGHHENDLNQV